MDLTGEQWALLEPVLGTMPRRADRRGRPWRDRWCVPRLILRAGKRPKRPGTRHDTNLYRPVTASAHSPYMLGRQQPTETRRRAWPIPHRSLYGEAPERAERPPYDARLSRRLLCAGRSARRDACSPLAATASCAIGAVTKGRGQHLLQTSRTSDAPWPREALVLCVGSPHRLRHQRATAPCPLTLTAL